MTGILAAVSIIIAVILGWWIAMVFRTAVASFSQERVQRKERYWQDETARARAAASRLAEEKTAGERPPTGREDWPQPS